MAFGVAAVVLKPHQLERLREYAASEQQYRESGGPEDCGQKCVSLPVNHTLTLCLSYPELEALTDLLDQAAALLTAYTLLS